MSEPVTLSSMSVTNFQGIIDAKVNFTGGTVYISGQNGAGKSSFLHAVACLFFGVDYAGKMPIRQGEKSAELIGKLSNGLECRMLFTEAGATLTVRNSEGLKLGTPRKILDQLIGMLAFDPLRFITELNDKQQIEQLKTICGLDFTELDKRRAELYARRTDVNRTAKEAEAAVSTAKPHDPTAPTTEIDASALMQQLKEAQAHNAENDRLAKEIESGKAALAKCDARIAEITAELAKLNENKLTWTQGIAARIAALDMRAKADTATIEQQIANSGAENAKLAANRKRAELEATAAKWKAESESLTQQIDAIDAEKTARLTAARMPIDDLSFSDEYVTYRGKPLSQASTREQMEVSFAICASLNPTLRCVIIPHGSLITPSNRPHFEAIAEKYGMQPLVELADESGSVPGIIISEGRVVSAT